MDGIGICSGLKAKRWGGGGEGYRVDESNEVHFTDEIEEDCKEA